MRSGISEQKMWEREEGDGSVGARGGRAGGVLNMCVREKGAGVRA